jgi:hypothetical protein
MYKSKQITTAYLLAGNPGVSPSLLEVLSRSNDPSVRSRVAENTAAPVHTLVRLLKDADSEVRLSLAHNPAAPSWFIEVLAADESADVRLSLAEMHNLSEKLLEFLSRDGNPYVSHRASLTLSRIALDSLRTAAGTVAA